MRQSGDNAKYLTYSLYDQIQKVIAISLTQVTEAGSSNKMEKAGLIKTLQEVKGKEHKIEQKEDIDHQFDVWHFSKSIKTKLLNKCLKEKRCEELKPWIKSICNHFWWAYATFENDGALLKEKWTNIIFHIQNRHT